MDSVVSARSMSESQRLLFTSSTAGTELRSPWVEGDPQVSAAARRYWAVWAAYVVTWKFTTLFSALVIL